MSEYNPRNVEEGTRDFILHNAGRAPEKVTVYAEGFGYVVEVKQGTPLPEGVIQRLQLILPEEYRLELT